MSDYKPVANFYNKKSSNKNYLKIQDTISDFILIEAVRFNQNTWVDTGIKGNLNTEADVIFKLERSAGAGSGAIFGSRGKDQSNQANAFAFGTGSGKNDADSLLYVGFNGSYYNTSSVITLKNWQIKREIRVKKDYIFTKNLETASETILTPSMNDAEFETPTNLLLGGYTTKGNYPSNSIKGLVYLCKIWESNQLIRDFKPAKRKRDNKIGFFDIIENKFYTETPNSTAEFTEE